MTQLIMQYVLIVLLVVGLGYFVYLLKDKGVNISEDYFGIAYTVLGFLQVNEANTDNVKRILRAVSLAVNYVETNYKDEDNITKEEKALVLAREAVEVLDFQSEIRDENLRQIIRLGVAFLPPTNKNSEELDDIKLKNSVQQ
ncbi:hypothetical protein [Clostridium ganghwense]|uniref:Phage holin n=1 Tax=Clostridium ganghwense TaxID=312089 RepID=A0ABT4CUJ3_9CLOT|nr:hypothetical protein [Clostridium ganghwense]MCY6372743.1 hypothetical protein [Clostridium ganghwense]